MGALVNSWNQENFFASYESMWNTSNKKGMNKQVYKFQTILVICMYLNDTALSVFSVKFRDKRMTLTIIAFLKETQKEKMANVEVHWGLYSCTSQEINRFTIVKEMNYSLSQEPFQT